MKQRRIGRPGFLPLIFAVAWLLMGGGAKADQATGWRLRVDFGVFEPGGSGIVVDTGTSTFQAELGSGVGAGVRGEYQFSPRLGVDFGFFSGASVNLDIHVWGGSASTGIELTGFAPFAVGLDVHLTPRSRVDLYLGPQLALIRYGSVRVSTGSGFTATDVSVDNDVGPGAILGLDILLGEHRRWALQTNLRYYRATMTATDSVGSLDGDFDPMVFSVGFGYRF